MIDLDTRARRAATGVRENIAATRMELEVPPTVRNRSAGVFDNNIWMVLAGSLTAIVILVAIANLRPSIVADDEATASTTTVTSAPAEPSTTQALAPETDPDPTTTTSSLPPSTTVPDTTSPMIEVTSPQDGEVVRQKTVTFKGMTEPGAKVTVGPYAAEVTTTGEWSIALVLNPGPNRASFTATDAAGNTAITSINVTYEPEEAKDSETTFSAFQKYGSCSEDPAYDVFYGQGEPGTEVQIFSDYGSGSTIIGEDGNWKLKVFFETAPFNETFKVTVEADGVKKTFEFTRLQDK